MDPNRFGAMLKLWKNNIPEECTTILFSQHQVSSTLGVLQAWERLCSQPGDCSLPVTAVVYTPHSNPGEKATEVREAAGEFSV